jgi:hypothetical protein
MIVCARRDILLNPFQTIGADRLPRPSWDGWETMWHQCGGMVGLTVLGVVAKGTQRKTMQRPTHLSGDQGGTANG